MSRRVSLAGLIVVVLVWCGVLLTPALRNLLFAQTAPARAQLLEKLGQKDNSFADVLKANPRDPRVLAAQAERAYDPKKPDEDQRKTQLRSYDKLIEKVPDEKWLIQNRLRLSTSGGIHLDVGGFMPPEYRSQQGAPWLSREEILQTLKIAERGARLDSQNSFYDWMRAICLFALKRDEEALRAFHDGARKPHFDDGVLRDSQIRLQVLSMQKPLLWENRVFVLAAQLLPHFSIMRNANRAALWQGAQWERKGDHARALEIYGDQMKLSAVMRRDSTNLISLLVAESLLRQTWGSMKRKATELNAFLEPSEVTRARIRRQSRDLSRAFADYAARHGRRDLAQAALREGSEVEGTNLSYALQAEYFYGGSTRASVQNIGKSNWVGISLLRALFVTAAAWLALAALSLALRPKRVLLSLLDVAASATFCVVIMAVLFSVALRLGATDEEFSQVMLMMGEEGHAGGDPWIVTLMWLPLGISVLYCLAATQWRGRKSTPARELQSALPPQAAHETHAQIKSGLLLKARMIWVLAVLAAVAWWVWISSWPALGTDALVYGLLPVPLIVGALISWLWRRRLRHLNWPHFIAWSQSTLGVLIVLGSVAYFICALMALPLRREADARLDDFIARGEVAVLRDAVSAR